MFIKDESGYILEVKPILESTITDGRSYHDRLFVPFIVDVVEIINIFDLDGKKLKKGRYYDELVKPGNIILNEHGIFVYNTFTEALGLEKFLLQIKNYG